MKIRTLGRHFRESFRNIWRNGWMTFASISTVSVTLLILGVFVLLALNLDNLSKYAEKTVEIRVFLKDGTTDQQIDQLHNRLKTMPEISEVVFIPKEEGLKQLKEGFGEQGYLLEGLEEENPLPDGFLVKTLIPQETAKVAELLSQMEEVDKVRYGKGVVEKLFMITNIVRNVGLILIVGLAFTAMFLIANTIKLTILSRKNEIEIMKLVGSTNSFIRWPFFIEGSLLGLVGAVIPLVLLLFGYDYLLKHMDIPFIMLLPIEPLWGKLTLLLLGIGVFIGIWGSITSIRKFLRV